MSTEAFTQDLRKLADPALLRPHLQARTQRGADTSKNQNWGAIVVPYIDARGAGSILDQALGVAGWSFVFHTPPTKRPNDKGFGAIGRLTLYIELPNGTTREIVHEDIGAGGDDSMETGAKGAASDSLKRCATQAGVGRVLGALGEIKVPAGECYVKGGQGGKMQAKDAAVGQALATWRETLTKWGRGWADAGHDSHPEVPANEPGTGEQAEHGTEPHTAPVPEGHHVDPETAEVVPNTPVDRTDMEPPPDDGPPAEQMPAAPEGNLVAVALSVGAPGEGTDWRARSEWLVGRYDKHTANSVVQAVTGTKFHSKLRDDGVWLRILLNIKEGAVAQATKEAA